MGTPEDVMAEKYFTPPTLTEMLVNCDTYFEADQISASKRIFKEWLRTVGLPNCYPNVEDGIKHLLITLIDEP